jgi:hypothetical protein
MAARLDHYLVNVIIWLLSLPTSSVKNSKNKLREDSPKSIMMKKNLRKTNNLWTR